jgi:hypothetical protein
MWRHPLPPKLPKLADYHHGGPSGVDIEEDVIAPLFASFLLFLCASYFYYVV